MMNLKFGFFKDSLEKFRDQDCKDSKLKRKNEFVTYFFFFSFFFLSLIHLHVPDTIHVKIVLMHALCSIHLLSLVITSNTMKSRTNHENLPM